MFLSFFILASLTSSEEQRSWQLKELLSEALSKNLEYQEAQKEAAKAAAHSGVARAGFFPELGVEGGGRSNREREKRNDLFYYGYGRYNLFRGFKDLHSYFAFSSRQELAGFKEQQVKNSVAREIARHFYELLYLNEAIRLRMADFKLSETQIEMAKKKESAGLTTKADLYEFQLHQSALEADLSLLDQERKDKLRKLARLAGLGEVENIEVDGNLELNSEPPSLEQLLSLATSQNESFRAAETAKRVALYEKRSAMSGWSPSVDVEAQYGKLMDTDFIESRKNSWAVVGKITLPLFSGFSTYQEYEFSKSEFEQKELAVLRTKKDLENEVRSLFGLWKSLKQRLKIERDRKQNAKKYYELTLSEYRRGVKNSPDLAGATDQMLESQLKEAELLRDLQLTQLRLAEATGQGVLWNE